MSATIDQKEYLKKYLGGKKSNSKKKKKKRIPVGSGIKIIDDDIDASKMCNMDDAEIELMFESEDAPQIAAIIDERSEELKRMQEVGRGTMWKVIGERSPPMDLPVLARQTKGENKISDCDISPPRRTEINNRRKTDHSNHRLDNHRSPPRKKYRSPIDDRRNKPCPHSDMDLSPPRRSGKYSLDGDQDLSPPRQAQARRSDLSPSDDVSSQKPRSGSSPSDDRNLSERNWNKRTSSNNRDLSPPRRRKRSSPDRDLSPPRRRHKSSPDKDLSPPRKNYRTESLRPDLSPPRKGTFSNSTTVARKSRWSSMDIKSEKGRDHHDNDEVERHSAKTTLDGKMAGLQNAKSLATETLKIRRREDRLFAEMSQDVSGRNSKPVVRDRSKRETSAEREEKREREERQKELDAKYAKWGRGLKQSEAHDANVREYMHEANKPVARYKGDSDLEQMLKNQEREGDPMLEYLKSKTKGQNREDGAEDRPIYKGAYPPNRFNIRPGYRWDGVDRSNGYEKKYFESKNKRIAQESEAYKWSTEDM